MARIITTIAFAFLFIRSAWAVATNDPAAALFDPGHLLEVSISIAPSDWEKLCGEHHDLLAALGPNRLDHPEPKPYKTYRADVTIDGTVMKGVGLRKRGFLGSASFDRPSLGIRIDEYEAKDFRGLKRLCFNNNQQDPSRIHQVLAYRTFNKAGVPAPRCNLARVTVNGKFLGIYSHVEAIEKPFLKSRFGDASGNLYEGQVSDFRPDWVKTFEKKNHKQETERSDLEAMVKALEKDDAQLLSRVEKLVNIDAYLNFWAVESLIGHWDSYSAGGNNFFVYKNPSDQKFQFIAWGADSVFGDRNPFARHKTPESVQARSMLPYRLYHLEAVRERYRQRLREILATVWNEQELLEEVNRLEALLKAEALGSKIHFEEHLKKVRRFINTRRVALNAELTNTAPVWNIPLSKSPCIQKNGKLNVGFETTWANKRPANPLNSGTANLTLEWAGAPQKFNQLGVIAGPAEDAIHAGCPTITLIGAQGAELKVILFLVQPKYFKPGSCPVDGFGVASIFLEGSFLGLDFKLNGLPVGTLKLMEAGQNPGDKVVGKVQADIYEIGD